MPGGVEIMALTTTSGFQEDCPIFSYDGANAFNSMYRHRVLPALAEVVSTVVPYAANLIQRDFLQEVVYGGLAKLVKALVPMENA